MATTEAFVHSSVSIAASAGASPSAEAQTAAMLRAARFDEDPS